MNPDREFADYLMSMTPEEFDQWADSKSIVEVERATETIRRAIMLLSEEMDMYIESELEYTGYEDAQEVLAKFTLHGLNG